MTQTRITHTRSVHKATRSRLSSPCMYAHSPLSRQLSPVSCFRARDIVAGVFPMQNRSSAVPGRGNIYFICPVPLDLRFFVALNTTLQRLCARFRQTIVIRMHDTHSSPRRLFFPA